MSSILEQIAGYTKLLEATTSSVLKQSYEKKIQELLDKEDDSSVKSNSPVSAGDPRFKCPHEDCDRHTIPLSSKQNLEKHLVKIHGPGKKQKEAKKADDLKCLWCDHVGATKQAVQKHMYQSDTACKKKPAELKRKSVKVTCECGEEIRDDDLETHKEWSCDLNPKVREIRARKDDTGFGHFLEQESKRHRQRKEFLAEKKKYLEIINGSSQTIEQGEWLDEYEARIYKCDRCGCEFNDGLECLDHEENCWETSVLPEAVVRERYEKGLAESGITAKEHMKSIKESMK